MLDVHNAFLNGDILEEVYMMQPPGFENTAHPHHICNLKLHGCLPKWGFTNSLAHMSIFFKHSSTNLIVVLVYVDDILVTVSDATEISRLLAKLHPQFALNDLGGLSYFLGIQVTKQGDRMYLCQERYMKELLYKAGMTDCNPAPTPMAFTGPLSRYEGNHWTTQHSKEALWVLFNTAPIHVLISVL